jgi:hypothetical protein
VTIRSFMRSTKDDKRSYEHRKFASESSAPSLPLCSNEYLYRLSGPGDDIWAAFPYL